MAYVTGTASSHTDLWAKLDAFLTSDSSLSASNQKWTSAWTNGFAAVYRGPGLSGNDQIYVGLKLVSDPVADSYYIEARGMTGVLSSATDLDGHPNVSSAKRMFLDSGPMLYWFVGNGRRFIAVVRIGGVYESLYGGFFLPYSSPTAYPYPVFIGGSSGDTLASDFNWRSVADGHANFPYSTVTFSGSTLTNQRSAAMIDPMGQWREAHAFSSDASRSTTDVAIGPMNFFEGPAASPQGSASAPGYNWLRGRVRNALGGLYAVNSITLTQKSPDDQTYGILDGCFEVSGYGNAPENTLTVSGVSHLVLQDTFRSARDRFWAIALE